MKVDTRGNRNKKEYATEEYALRILWSFIKPLFRYSPRTFHAWRRFLLRLMGAEVGKEVHVYNSAIIYFPWNLVIGDWSSIGEWVLIYNLGPIRIGSHVTISQRAHLCAGTHDHRDPKLPLRKPPIVIEGQAWICADAFIGPGVTVGEGAVVGARAVVMHDIGPWEVVAGNPAKSIGLRQFDYGEKAN